MFSSMFNMFCFLFKKSLSQSHKVILSCFLLEVLWFQPLYFVVIIHLEFHVCVWGEIRFKIHFSIWISNWSQIKHFCKNQIGVMVLSFINQVTLYVKVCFWYLYFVSLNLILLANTVALYQGFVANILNPPAMFSSIASAILVPWSFHMNFRISFSISKKVKTQKQQTKKLSRFS